ncbi:hypothetical protein [Kiloniella majae]|uniref:hypothetical protein n=1 Tax=Kiloniella majae TaxID=1938558 RepID=UPI00130264C0|nr:hypothetical protein [Kiloniella majae]
MVFLKPLISFLMNLNQTFGGSKAEVPCVIPVKAHGQNNKLGQNHKLRQKRK